METTNLVLIEHFCTTWEVEFSFINSLKEQGLIEIIVLENKEYIAMEQLKEVERAIRFHYDLDINLEGIDVISNLLKQIEDLQQELNKTKNKLRIFDVE